MPLRFSLPLMASHSETAVIFKPGRSLKLHVHINNHDRLSDATQPHNRLDGSLRRRADSEAAFTRIRIARYPDIRVEGTRVSAKRLHVSRSPELLYDTHAQCGTNMICARVSKVTAVLQRGVFRDFLSFHESWKNLSSLFLSMSNVQQCKSTPSKETFLWEADETELLLSKSSIVN